MFCFVEHFFIPVEFIVSQEACESRATIYDQVQNQCCQFLKFLIKKKSLCFFLQMVVGVVATRAFLFTIGKNYNWKKVKTKKGLCTN